MRSRLWKCSSEQVRLATSPEAQGAEVMSDPGVQKLLREAQVGRAGAGVNVAAEGPPPREAWEPGRSAEVEASPIQAPLPPPARSRGLLGVTFSGWFHLHGAATHPGGRGRWRRGFGSGERRQATYGSVDLAPD
eukprot:6777110-Pyramimonas_sp.AAC.1